MTVLETNDLCKNYGSIRALDKLNIKVEAGQIMGLLGPNGSGKTTTLGVILSVLGASSGSYEWFGGQYGNDHRKHIGSILETPNFFPYLNADENLDIIRRTKGAPKQDFGELLQLVKLVGRRKSKFHTYSLGMKQRLAIAATLIGDPQVVIFDEPTNGLDPEGIAEVRNTLMKVAERGKTVFMASHILAEVEKICSHVTILKKGKLLASGPVGSILSNDRMVILSATDNYRLMTLLQSIPEIKSIKEIDGKLECMADEEVSISEINKKAVNSGIDINHLENRKRKLEEEFLEITKS